VTVVTAVISDSGATASVDPATLGRAPAAIW
jgi:hypothetical protein